MKIVLLAGLAAMLCFDSAGALEMFVWDLVDPDDRPVAFFRNDADVYIELWSPEAFTITHLETGVVRHAHTLPWVIQLEPGWIEVVTLPFYPPFDPGPYELSVSYSMPPDQWVVETTRFTVAQSVPLGRSSIGTLKGQFVGSDRDSQP